MSPPLGGLLLAAALLTVVLALAAEELRAREPSASECGTSKTTETACQYSHHPLEAPGNGGILLNVH